MILIKLEDCSMPQGVSGQNLNLIFFEDHIEKKTNHQIFGVQSRFWQLPSKILYFTLNYISG